MRRIRIRSKRPGLRGQPTDDVRARPLVGLLVAVGLMGAFLPSAQADDGFEFTFDPLASSTACTTGGDRVEPFVLPAGYGQRFIATGPDFKTADGSYAVPDPANPDQNTLNETGAEAGRYLYRTHEVRSDGAISRTDLVTGETEVVAHRSDWERLDGIFWTPWHTILFAEEVKPPAPVIPDPEVPETLAGLMYEMDPVTGAVRVLPAVGARAHEGIAMDNNGNLYGISEAATGYIYKFVPKEKSDLSAGTLYALRLVTPNAIGTGAARWVKLDATQSRIDSDAAAEQADATIYKKPEDVAYHATEDKVLEDGTVLEGNRYLYVAESGNNRVLAVNLNPAGANKSAAFVTEYVKGGVNDAPVISANDTFLGPDNLAFDGAGNLWIAEDHGVGSGGDDIWVAHPGTDGSEASDVVRFASLTDCKGEPSGIYFDKDGARLFVNVMHRGDPLDPSMTDAAMEIYPLS